MVSWLLGGWLLGVDPRDVPVLREDDGGGSSRSRPARVVSSGVPARFDCTN